MRRSNTKTILTACEMSFAGKSDTEIAADLEVSVSAVSRWRKNEIWKEFEQELISAHKESLLEAHQLTTLEDSTQMAVGNQLSAIRKSRESEVPPTNSTLLNVSDSFRQSLVHKGQVQMRNGFTIPGSVLNFVHKVLGLSLKFYSIRTRRLNECCQRKWHFR